MGLRFRKSIRLGGGFNINLSKSGVGYSWGTKGFRVTKKASGETINTTSIPGTGVSYTSKPGGNNVNKNNCNSNQSVNTNNYYNTKSIANGNVKDIYSEELEDMIASANKALRLNKCSTICLIISAVCGCAYPIFFILTMIFLIWKICVKKKGVIELQYTIDDYQRNEINKWMYPLQKLANSNKIWRVVKTNRVIDNRYSSGANNTLERIACVSSNELPFPFRSNISPISFKCGKEIFIFLPDMLLVVQDKRFGALSYADLQTNMRSIRFVESAEVPADAMVVDRTWKYVNKNGEPDKRFRDNRVLPICCYVEFSLLSAKGSVNTILMFSNCCI